MVSYGAMGFVAALTAHQIAAYTFWPKIEATMLLLAGLMFLGSSIAGMTGKLHRLLMPLHAAGSGHTFLRGALLGFMPCGLIYAALMVVAASANPWLGALGMMVFVLGTLPALWVANLGVELLSLRWRGTMQQVGRVMMALNGLALLITAGRLVV